MTSWPEIVTEIESRDQPSILITVGAARGSTPRETGTRMLVSADHMLGTIGGGQLEFVVIETARKILLETEKQSSRLLKLPLGPELAQCCGGYTEILLSPICNQDHWFTDLKRALNENRRAALITSMKNATLHREVVSLPNDNWAGNDKLREAAEACSRTGQSFFIEDSTNSEDFNLVEPLFEERFQLTLFGAGHVGKAIVQTLSPLPCHISWVDARADEFPQTIPENVEKIITSNPKDIIAATGPGGYFLVMTHSHQMDLEITADILEKGDSAYLGLIGSETKRKRFFKRLGLRGFNETDLSKVTCPVGLSHLTGKHPTEIAISVAAEILQLHQKQHSLKPATLSGQSHKLA